LNERFVAEQDFYVRYAETDAQAVVHHSSYVIYMEEARSHYARSRGQSYVDFEATGHFLVVTELEVRYLAPARYGDLLRTRCWIEEMKSRKVIFAYEISNPQTGKVLVTARTIHICVDREGSLRVIPPAWRAWAD